MRLDVSERPLASGAPTDSSAALEFRTTLCGSFPNPTALDKTIADILGEPFKINKTQATRQIELRIRVGTGMKKNPDSTKAGAF